MASSRAAGSGSKPLSRPSEVIKEPRDYDVLLGRGAGIRMHVGNRQFLDWVEQVKPAYHATQSWDIKNFHANRVIDAVKSCKGRFLERDEKANVWREISGDRILAKTKQALREKSIVGTTAQCEAQQVVHQPLFQQLGPEAFSHVIPFGQPWVQTSGDLLAAQTVSGGPPRQFAGYYSRTDLLFASLPRPQMTTTTPQWTPMLHRLGFLSQPPPLLPQPQHNRAAVDYATVDYATVDYATVDFTSPRAAYLEAPARLPPFSQSDFYLPHHNWPKVNPMSSTERRVSVEELEASRPHKSSESKEEASASLPVDSNVEEEDDDDSQHLTEEEIAAARFLFSELTTPERPLQDEILTEEEKSDAIADLFGDLCTITQQPRKRIKRSAAPSISKEVSILLLQMKKEIELMPNKDKQAWVEASRKARESEIDGRRQELFLRREGMDPTRAALRWVAYWEERRRIFGPDKFCLPMTLHGAMRDDHVAMESGFFRLLPGLDESGRHMSLVIMRKHTRDGYSTDSMVRCAFYFQEVLCQHPNAAKGLVRFLWYKGSTMFEADRTYEWTVTDLQNRAFPIPACATHFFCLPMLVARLLTPISLAQLDKNTRARCVIHHVKENQVVDALSEYGIRKEVIPREMGGDCHYGNAQYLADRRAFEAEWDYEEEEEWK